MNKQKQIDRDYFDGMNDTHRSKRKKSEKIELMIRIAKKRDFFC